MIRLTEKLARWLTTYRTNRALTRMIISRARKISILEVELASVQNDLDDARQNVKQLESQLEISRTELEEMSLVHERILEHLKADIAIQIRRKVEAQESRTQETEDE